MDGPSPPRVLVVDDNAAMRTLAMHLFESAGADVVAAGSGELTIELARRERFAVVVSDVVMPRIDGFELARMLREIAGMEATPIVLVSTVFVNEQDRAVGDQMGADLSLAGPLTQGLATDILRKAVSGTLRRRAGKGTLVVTTARARARGLNSVSAISDALARSQALFEAAFRATAWPQLLVDQDDIVRTANRAACTLTGLSESQLAGTRFLDLVSPDFRATAARAVDLWRQMDTQVEMALAGPAGQSIPVRVSSARLIAPAGDWQTIVQLEDLTLRREQEAALAESEARFRAAFEAAPLGEALIAPNGTILQANAALGRMLGVLGDLLRGRELVSFIPPEERAEVAGVIDRARTGASEPGRSQAQFLALDGVTRAGIVTSAALPGRSRSVLVQITDVTRERQAVEELRASEASLNAMFDQSPIAMAVSSLDGTLQRVNHAVTRMTGYDDAALQGKDLSFLLEDPLAARARPSSDPAVAHGQLFRRGLDITCKDQTRKRVVATGTETSGFAQPYILTHLEDVTAQRKAEAESARRARNSERLAELHRTAIQGLDLETFLSHATRLVHSTLEASSVGIEHEGQGGQAPPRPGCIRVPIPTLVGPLGTLVIEGASGRSWRPEEREFAASAAAVIGAASDRIRNEESLRRTERLSGLGTLVAGVAHEINNPLMYIRGNVELFQMALDDESALPRSLEEERTRDSLSRGLVAALEGLDRIGRITASLRQIARSTNGSRHVEPLAPIVQNVLSVAAARLKDADTTADLEDAAACVNPSEIAQVILNLVFNAGDATAGRTDARIRLRSYLAGPDAVIEVEDNGPGIPPEAQRSIFTPFFTTKPTGTGLGLSLGRRIALDHGGDLSFATSPRGTTFTLRLPAAQPESIHENHAEAN